jgi:integrase
VVAALVALVANGIGIVAGEEYAAKITKADGSPRLNFHCLRHFRASMLIEVGANPKEVMVEMGHSNIAMTYDLYGHLFTDEDAD